MRFLCSALGKCAYWITYQQLGFVTCILLCIYDSYIIHVSLLWSVPFERMFCLIHLSCSDHFNTMVWTRSKCCMSADSTPETCWVQAVQIVKEQEDCEPSLWWCSVWYCSQREDHSGIFGWGAEDCEEGAQDPEDQGQGLQELNTMFKFPEICFSMKFSDEFGKSLL